MGDPTAAGQRSEPAIDLAAFEAASHEVDRTLIRWSLSLSPRERLRAATRSARMLGRFRHAEASEPG